jgi:uncharacterized protein (UPF0276 family)
MSSFSMAVSDLQDLGVGVIYAPGLEPLIEAGRDLIDVIEIEPEPFWFKSRSRGSSYHLSKEAVDRFICYPHHKIVHSVGFPIGGTSPLDENHLAPLTETIDAVRAHWISEHLSFNRARNGDREFYAGFLLPPLQTPEGVAIAASNIRRFRSRLSVPFAFETGVNYLRPLPGEISDGRFFKEVAEEADCGILLDLHNLWTNERNGRQSVLDTVAELSLDRVLEIHLAGGQAFQDYWVDAHSDLVPAPVMELAEQIVPHLPNLKAIVFEIMADYISAKDLSLADLLEQIHQMRGLWNCRCRGLGESISHRLNNAFPPPTSEVLDIPTAIWEDELGGLAIGHPIDRTCSTRLVSDPGIDVYRNLVSSVRAGMTVATLTLTCRLLRLKLGEPGFNDLLEKFRKTVPPEMFASDEAYNFGKFVVERALYIPHLNEVLAFELAAQQVVIEGSSRTVRFNCDPIPLLTALGKGHLPDLMTPSEYELTIEAPNIGVAEHNSLREKVSIYHTVVRWQGSVGANGYRY